METNCGIFLGNSVSVDKGAKWQTIYCSLTTIPEHSMSEYGLEELTTCPLAVAVDPL